MNSQKLLQIRELVRITKDTPYALKTYLQTFDNTQKRFVPLELFDDQLQLLEDFENYNENITKKYRQAGVTTVTAAWISKKLQLAKPETPEKDLILANKRDTAIEMANKVRAFLEQWPEWMNVGFDPNKNSESRFRLNNGCEVKAVATSGDALRGYTPTILIFDEAAYIEAGEQFWSASMASLSTGGKVILISTPNGQDPIYYSIYDQSIRGMNDFHITDLKWFHDPRYTKDLRWVKVNDLVHYMLNRGEYVDEDICVYSTDKSEYDKLISDGYKPFSSWYETMSKKFLFDKRRISQELECDFLGSGDSVIPMEVRERLSEIVMEPKEKYIEGNFWQWKEPVIGHRYIMGIDVSRGDSDDFSSINIIDFDEGEQVAEYIGKLPPDDLANVAYKWGILYGEPLTVIDITGGMGVGTSRKLQELGYKNLYVEGVNTMNPWEYNKKALEKIPGINFNNKRVQIISAFEEQLRHGFKTYSLRLLNELSTFVYVNGRADHLKGKHDDAIMSISIAMYAGELCFAQLTRNDNANKAMLESWVLSERTYDPNQSLYSYGGSFDQIGSMSMDDSGFNPTPTNVIKENYREYSWLFGGNKRK